MGEMASVSSKQMLDQQKQVIKSFDPHLDRIKVTVDSMRTTTNMIHAHIKEDNQMLESLNSDADRVTSRLARTRRLLTRVSMAGDASSEAGRFCIHLSTCCPRRDNRFPAGIRSQVCF